MTPLLRNAVAPALVAALVATGCGQRPKEAPATAVKQAAVTGDPSCSGTTVHDTHVRTFRCDVCHPTGATFGFDTPYTFAGGTTTAGGTIVMATGQATSCTVACHYPKGAATRTIAWNTPGPLACTACHDTATLPASHPAVAANAPRSACESCHQMTAHTDGAVLVSGHDAAWMDTTSPSFHAASANQGLARCQGCHGTDLRGGTARVSCGQCHDASLPAGVTSWAQNCTMCHGGTGDQTGAPPKATWGNGADPIRTGAHAAHVRASAIAPAADCSLCHQKPADAFATGHLDPGPAEVAFAGLAASGVTPSWTRATATCASTYCHGGRLAGGTNTAPVWTAVGQGQAACGTCHGLPPPAPHPVVDASLAGCVVCHPDTMAADGTLIAPSAGGRHLDGVVEVAGGHGPEWIDPASPGFHAYSANEGLGSCQSCHGANLDGVGGTTTVSCAQCHGATWRTSCTTCHGGTNDQTGAPPRTTWGNAADPLRVGAHARHLSGGAVGGPFDCGVCHPKPADALDAGHIGPGPATVAFSGLAAAGGAANPSWNRASGTCASNYCHGGYAGTFRYFFYDTWYDFPYAGGNGTPSWTGGPMTCTSCHGDPPAGGHWHSGQHGGGNGCDLCHPGVDAAGTRFLDASRHMNGTVDVAAQFGSSCFHCH